MNEKKVWIILGSTILVLCLCTTAIAVAVGYSFWERVQSPSDPMQKEPDASVTQPFPEDAEPVLPDVTQQPASREAMQTLSNLQTAEIPSADPLVLMQRFTGLPKISPTVEPSPRSEEHTSELQ